MNDFQFDTIEQALGDLRAGKVILVTDDPDRENEGDLICAAQFATTENVNFMASVGKGLICMPTSAELCRRLRSRTTAPVLFLSARDTELDKVVGLEIGGDDYLAKPFGVRELIARVRALLRRGTLEAPDSGALVAAGITLDEDRHTAVGPNGPIDLTPREFELLAALMKDAGKVVTREDLLREAWGWEYITETKTVDTHIKRLRDKISQAGFDPSIIETVRGYGYRLKA